jgi:hypothetical protein
MPHRNLIAVALVVVLMGCRDGPTTVDVPPQSSKPVVLQSTAHPDVFLTVRQMLDDPLVLEISQALGDQTVTSRLDGLRDDIDRHSVSRDVPAMRRALISTRDLLHSDSEESDMVLRDVLSLVLDDAEMMLVSESDVTQPDEAAGERVKH